ncbi:NmrA family NAD(P)-binding protein [Vallicoccus soli]|uniref:SDR family NAD(P)-dependent oxidoreductase n=1 Tax=Vallicoccus soli TaxID=2339232 RepID=A0A3A3Z1M9_9ACTN|nr:NmrA family NAD(P)-binding protein [Vallicoccus soli]RJK98159.1 SDR family NAD(P)-dependent oxidoreductase [Vallicoccus soli]
MPPLLVTGATGTVGRPLVAALHATGADVRAASPHPGPGGVTFDLRDPGTWDAALRDVRTMFLLRPPDAARVERDVVPAVARGRQLGLRHVVLLSVQGADRAPFLPHAALERWLRGSGLAWTFVRPSYFMQNLTGPFGADVRERHRIVVPAGTARTAFVDAHDVAAVAARALLDPAAHAGRAWTPTGEALSYDEVAGVLTAVLGRRVRYERPGALRYARHARRDLGMAPALVAVTTALHTVARLGLAGGLTDDVRRVTGRAPTSFLEFARRERAAWEPAAGPAREEGS